MSSFFDNVKELPGKLVSSFWEFLKTIAGAAFKLVFGALLATIDAIYPLGKLAFLIRSRMPGFWEWIMNQVWVQQTVSKFVFEKFGSAAPPRPYPFDMAADGYASWNGLVDKEFSGRHLPPVDDDKKILSREEMLNLVLRDGSSFKPTPGKELCPRSTVLFASFAQWFTDSFLRTAHGFKFDKKGNVLADPDTGRIERAPGRHRKNTSNHEIDLCQIYGMGEAQTSMLRLKSEKDRGCLKFDESEDGEFPPKILSSAKPGAGGKLAVKREFSGLHDERVLRRIFLGFADKKERMESLFACGLEHGNSTIGNSLMNTIFLREHNRVARKIAAANPRWDDERVFQTTRNVMIVELLNVVISDYIRHISPLDLPLRVVDDFIIDRKWNRPNRIAIEFNILYRWHSLVPDEFDFFEGKGRENAGQFQHNNVWLLEHGVGAAVTAFSKQRAGRIFLGNTPNWLAEVERDTIDLVHEARLQPYNKYRERFGFKAIKTFRELTETDEQAAALSDAYGGDVDALDWYIGLFAERHGDDMMTGSLLQAMVAHDAFTQALTNPLLAPEVFNEETFSQVGFEIAKNTLTLQQIVERNVKNSGDVLCRFRHTSAERK